MTLYYKLLVTNVTLSVCLDCLKKCVLMRDDFKNCVLKMCFLKMKLSF